MNNPKSNNGYDYDAFLNAQTSPLKYYQNTLKELDDIIMKQRMTINALHNDKMQLKALLKECLENDLHSEGYNNSNMDKDLRERIKLILT